MGRFRNGYLRKCMNRSLPMWRKGQVSLGRSHLSDPRGGRLLHKEPQSMLLLGFKKGTTIETRFYVVLRLVLNFVGKGAPGPRTSHRRPKACSVESRMQARPSLPKAQRHIAAAGARARGVSGRQHGEQS